MCTREALACHVPNMLHVMQPLCGAPTCSRRQVAMSTKVRVVSQPLGPHLRHLRMVVRQATLLPSLHCTSSNASSAAATCWGLCAASSAALLLMLPVSSAAGRQAGRQAGRRSQSVASQYGAAGGGQRWLQGHWWSQCTVAAPLLPEGTWQAC